MANKDLISRFLLKSAFVLLYVFSRYLKYMSESFPHNPKMTPEDEKINEEINLIGRKISEDMDLEFNNVANQVEREAREKVRLTKYLLADLESYLRKNSEIDERMSLDEFTDIINGKDGNFDPLLRDKINQFIDKYETKVNLERPLSDFISFVSSVWEENENLVNPGKEKMVKGSE